MDIDRFVATNEELWSRVDALSRRVRRRGSMLSGADLDELVAGYQRMSTHLSLARTTYRDPGLTARLTDLVTRSGAAIYGTRATTWKAPLRFVTDTFPAAVWYARAFMAVSTALFLVPAAAMAIWMTNSPRALDVAAPPALREAYVEEDFEKYYSSDPAVQFATQVTTNNIQVAILAFASGILLCVGTLYVLIFNGASVGVVAGLFATVDQQAKFYGLILPHGLLELTAIFIAGGAGLRLGWTIIDPGDRTRPDALKEEGRRAVAIVIGLVGAFVIAGLIEGFVTGSKLPTWARVGTGVVAEVTFLGYVFVRGRAAARRGLTGQIGEQADSGWVRRPAATATRAP